MKLQILVDVFDNLMKSGIDRNGIDHERPLINKITGIQLNLILKCKKKNYELG